MSEFSERRQALEQARKAKQAARSQLFAEDARLRAKRRQRGELQRRMTDGGQAALEKLEREIQALSASVAQLSERDSSAARALAEQQALFEDFSDPREHIARLDDQFPILLFPLRLETRFKRIERGNATSNELWLRVYPDDIAVDTFEEMLAEVELQNARIYWTNIWKAGGDEGEKRAAWQALVKSHGAGRAFWIIEQFVPTNRAEEPAKAVGEQLLVVVTDVPLAPGEKPWVQKYWRAVFLAQNDVGSLEAAYAELVAELGQARAETILAEYAPQNLTARPASAEPVTTVNVVFLELPPSDALVAQAQPWMNPARTTLLPERFVVLGFNAGEQTLVHVGEPVPAELIVGPNPSAPADAQIRLENDELVVPEELRWMTDFDRAVKQGMGFRIALSPLQAQSGFDRLFVLGVRMSQDIQASVEQLEALIGHHQRSRKGFSLLPQGAPTNNVEDQASGYTWLSDADASYQHYFVQDHTDDPDDWRVKKDGRWLAESLGVAADVLKRSPNYFGTDQCEARAMNEALWPATLGYFMEQLMEPVFSAETLTSTRAYFNRYVLGRGSIPAVRIGRQPYGVLPASPYSRMGWLRREVLAQRAFDSGIPGQFQFLNRLYALIKQVDETWSERLSEVSYVGKPGVDPQQALLDVVGLHPSSVEFYQRYAESAEQLYNRLKLSGAGSALAAAFIALGYVESGRQLLSELGYDGAGELPEILNKFFLRSANLLKGPIIDDVPLSETEAIRTYHSDGSNYLQWLIRAARDSHDTLRQQAGFIEERPPSALLYLMLQHALDLSYVDTSIDLFRNANLLSEAEAQAAKREPKFVHIEAAARDPGSSWQYLYATEPAITDSQTLRVAEFIPLKLGSLDPYLNKQVTALEQLKDVPTARLERVFAEHLDCCSYRLDAWWLGLSNVQLSLMRSSPGAADGTPAPPGEVGRPARGSYLGAFGWLEDLRPEPRHSEAVELPQALEAIFNKPGQAPLTADSNNFGYIHAPSLNHAVTAAVLRNGYLSNATPENPESLAVNLSSDRVRLALGVVQGIQNGQSLSALLGYQLERGLHDREGLFLDSVIFELRNRFPLMAKRFSNTRPTEAVKIDRVEARNVIDGLALIQHVQSLPAADRSYPFGLDAELPEIGDASAVAAINEEVSRIQNINDAVSDLALAESVHQVVLGNYERAAGALDAYSKGHFPPTPEVIQTPRSGVSLTHRVGLHLKSSLDPDHPTNPTPRSKGEPAVNAWLGDMLPDLTKIYCVVEFFNHVTAATESVEVTAHDLGFAPVDLLYMIQRDDQQAMRALDDLVVRHVATSQNLRPDADIKILYRQKQPQKYSFFELGPYLADLQALLLRSRPLRPTDTRLPNEATSIEEQGASIREVKVTRVRDLLVGHNLTLSAFVADVELVLSGADDALVSAQAIGNVDRLIDAYSNIANEMNRFGLPGTGFGFAWGWRRGEYAKLVAKLDEVLARWNEKLSSFEARLVEFDNLDPTTSDERKLAFLAQAALLISTVPVNPPASGDPQDLLDELNDITRPGFEAARSALGDLPHNEQELGGLYQAIAASAASVALFDTQVLELEASRVAIVAFTKTLQSKATQLSSDVSARLADAALLIAGDPNATSAARIDELTRALRRITSEDFLILPEFPLSADHAAEWQNAVDDQSQLLTFLTDEVGSNFPVDDWLYGIARVREKLHRVESATMFAEALKGASIELLPLQFPYRENDSWLALQFPKTKSGSDDPFVIEEDKLLYTAHYHEPFDAGAPLHCGLLIDEWTEVVPALQETSGLAFHFDRPNTEPPQTLLLAMPADFTGSWQWQDLVDTLHEVLDMARKRAIEPQHVDQTRLARFLPATISSVTRLPIMQMLNLAYNNSVQFNVEP